MQAFLRPALSVVALAAGLGACTVGPDFQAPGSPKTDAYLPQQQATSELVDAKIPGGETQRIVQSLDIPGQWWGVFQSPQLNSLIEAALRANPDIHAAAASLKVAQLNAKAQRATLFPTIGLALGASQNQVAPILQSPLANQNTIFGLFTAGVTLTYALDIWGGNRRQIESLDALAEAQCFQLEGAYLSLASNVVAAAILEASLRAQVEATRRIVAAQRETLAILQRQSGLGSIPGADVATQQAAIAGFEQAEAQYRSSVLAAFRNVADTLNALEYDAITLKAAVDAERAAATSLNIARRRLELGDTTYVFVLIAELTYQQTQITRIQAQAARLTNTAALFQALGGGWWNRDKVESLSEAERLRCRPPTPQPVAASQRR